MIDELELFDEHPEWRPLLAAYQARQGTTETGWIARITAIEGLAAEQVSAVHGKLIGLGLLKFEMGTRAEGVKYQLTPLGRQALLPPESRQAAPEWQHADEAETSAA